MGKTRAGQGSVRCQGWLSTALVAALVATLFAAVAPAIGKPPGGMWFQIGTTHGNTSGYHWSAGAKVKTGKVLSEICSELSMVEPLREGALYAEGSDSTVCGPLSSDRDVMFTEVSFGSGDSRVSVFQALYRPKIRHVKVIFGSGERSVQPARIVRPSGSARNGLKFRFLVVALGPGESCVRKLVASDATGRVYSRTSLPPCGP
jgi:hypothetical protein